MIDNNSSDRNRFINGILIVVAIVLLVASIYSVYSAWRTGLAQSRAETASRLMAIRTSPRSTETPGINAWVSWSLLNSNLDEGDRVHEAFRRWVGPRSGNQFPDEFRGLLDVLRVPLPDRNNPVTIASDPNEGNLSDALPLEFRNVRFVENEDQRFVVTSRTNDEVQSNLESFCSVASTHINEIKKQWLENPRLPKLDRLKRIQSARVARFYVLNEDESLISLPLGESDEKTLFESEADEFRKNPLSPSFVSNNFFFNFQFEKPLVDQATFTGMYLDLGGLGLVASVMCPVVYDGKRCVLGADIAFDMDWESFAKNLSPNLVSHVVHVSSEESKQWQPWNEFLNDFSAGDQNLQSELVELAERELLDSESEARKSVYLATTRDGGDLMAIQVNRSTWLLLLVAADEIKLPWTTMLLTGLVLLSLFFRIEQSRRQAVVAQDAAHAEMQEKQNLLETMQVPLMVVDPNTDEVVFCNRAAETIGIFQGKFFGRDVVASDSESQQHYQHTQSLSDEHRRAYGVPIRLRDTTADENASVNYAIVRSVAVTAPIASLHADERHRLGILFLVNEQRDLDMLLKDRLDEARRDEKRQLSGLMNHGIDSLARILKNRIARSESNQSDPFAGWISGYLAERIQLVAWVLDHWGGAPSVSAQRIVERDTVVATLNKFNDLFKIVSEERSLREQLHWNNGVVSGDSISPKETIVLSEFDWTGGSCFSIPRDGVFGFFVGEVLTNAIRHGKPGSRVMFTVTENQIRNELSFVVENEMVDGRNQTAAVSKPFGGSVIIVELARLCGWSLQPFKQGDGKYVVQWSIPAIRPKSDGFGD